jgi:hypothetical protein
MRAIVDKRWAMAMTVFFKRLWVEGEEGNGLDAD